MWRAQIAQLPACESLWREPYRQVPHLHHHHRHHTTSLSLRPTQTHSTSTRVSERKGTETPWPIHDDDLRPLHLHHPPSTNDSAWKTKNNNNSSKIPQTEQQPPHSPLKIHLLQTPSLGISNSASAPSAPPTTTAPWKLTCASPPPLSNILSSPSEQAVSSACPARLCTLPTSTISTRPVTNKCIRNSRRKIRDCIRRTGF